LTILDPPTALTVRGEPTVEFATGEVIFTVVAPIEETGAGAVMLTVALADLVASATLRAVIVAAPEGTVVGAM